MQVIVADIDGTVLDVTERLAACLREAGVEPGSDPSATLDTLKGKPRSRFYDSFQSVKYTHLDTPLPAVIGAIRTLHDETSLPVVYLSGRVESMGKVTREALSALDLPFEAVLLRPRSQLMRRTTEFKVAALRDHGYEPVHAFDDDEAVLAAFGVAFPGVTLHPVGRRRHSPPAT